MDAQLPHADINRWASMELNLLHYSGALPAHVLEGAQLAASTPVHDLHGQVLFHRFPLVHDGVVTGYADVAAHTAFGAPLLAVHPLAVWDENAVLQQAYEAFRKRFTEFEHDGRDGFREARSYPVVDEVRFVAYSYPKIAVQFLHGQTEIAMLECFTWTEVPLASSDPNFARWSYLDQLRDHVPDLPTNYKEIRHAAFEQRLAAIGPSTMASTAGGVISRAVLQPVAISLLPTRSYELHYSYRAADHHACYEVRGQETSVWCVGASMQMVLDFYRYNYSQTKIAAAVGLGTPSHPNGLPYGKEDDVVTQLIALSSKALKAAKFPAASFNFPDYVAELDQNRPLITFIPGHSRTAAGYTESLLILVGQTGFRGLLIYDPWPPNAGVITRWENFDAQTYRFAFTANVTTI
jgi:hypothetical protein